MIPLTILLAGALTLAPLAAQAADAPTPAPSPSSSYTWTLAPSGADGTDGRVSLRYEIDPGQVASDAVALTNFSSGAATFAVYASDGIVTPEGDFDIEPPGTAAKDAGTWVAISSAGVEGAQPRGGGGVLVDVPAGGRVILPITVSVPDDASPGDHPAGVVAELVQGAGAAIQFSSRVGVRLHLRVTGKVTASLAATHVTASYVPSWNPFVLGAVVVDYRLENTGNVRLGAVAKSSVAAAFGAARTSTSFDRREILPRGAVAVHTRIPVWPLFLGWGTIAVTPSVVGDDQVRTRITAEDGSFFVAAIPWSQLALLVLLVGCVLLARWLMRRSARRVQARIDQAVAAAQASPDAAEPEPADADATEPEDTEPEDTEPESTGADSPSSEKPVDSRPTMR